MLMGNWNKIFGIAVCSLIFTSLIIVVNPTPREALKEFQNSNPKFGEETTQYTNLLFFANLKFSGNCDLLEDLPLETAILEFIQWTSADLISDVAHIQRGLDGLIRSESCLTHTLPLLVTLVEPTKNAELSEIQLRATAACIQLGERELRLDEATAGILGLASTKISKGVGELVQKWIRNNYEIEIPLVEKLSENALESILVDLVPSSSSHEALQSKICKLSRELQPKWSDAPRNFVLGVVGKVDPHFY